MRLEWNTNGVHKGAALWLVHFSWSTPLSQHITFALHYNQSRICVRKKEQSLSTESLWNILSRRTPQLTSSPKQTTTWCVLRSHWAMHFRNTLNHLRTKRFGATEYVTNMYSRIALLRSHQNPFDTVCIQTGVRRGDYSTQPVAQWDSDREIAAWFAQYRATLSSWKDGGLTWR